jgi:drug/metabolite transporter (DMT)-like permease
MIGRIKPRGFVDYGLFALLLSGMLVLLFWIQIGKEFGWVDCALALAAAIAFVFLIVLARRNEKAAWTAAPNWVSSLLIVMGTCFYFASVLMADSFFLHRGRLTAGRMELDVVVFSVVGVTSSVGATVKEMARKREIGTRKL